MKLTSIRKLVALATIGAVTAASAQVTLQNATLWQNTASRTVEVTYELTGSEPVYITLGIETNGIAIPAPVTVRGDVTTMENPLVEPGSGSKMIRWEAKKDWPGNLTADARAVVTAWFTNDPPASLLHYVVVDLSEGASATSYPVRYSVTPPNLGNNTCKTTELWLRRIPAGTFMMGAPDGEVGCRFPEREELHEVTLTQDFYIGVFMVTQKQYELVVGTKPAQYLGDLRPVERVSYNLIRGSTLGAQWPANNNVDSTSFMGLLRTKTGLTFDLPTDAQWERACRAGTTNALYTGKELTGSTTCPNMAEIARYAGNTGDGKGGYSGQHTAVGNYLPNPWGLYDMCGNVSEWCLDWYVDGLGTSPVTDPKGPTSGSNRVRHNAAYGANASDCRSAYRSYSPSSNTSNQQGFRAAIQP
ncbi:MAG: formylglycine-generating enzyme family protein [Kiritimatiellaeota bacterium]|nr:formylglycine-generating enzyme family protein [Kiritimatiellota bacterium]